MIARPFWLNRIETAWTEAPIAWLSGVRRTGKTTLAQELGAERTFYVNRRYGKLEVTLCEPLGIGG